MIFQGVGIRLKEIFDNLLTCEKCGALRHKDNIRTIWITDINQEVSYCDDSCYDYFYDYYDCCEYCDNYYTQDMTRWVDDEVICNNCFPEHYVHCEVCEEAISRERTLDFLDKLYCDTCYEDAVHFKLEVAIDNLIFLEKKKPFSLKSLVIWIKLLRKGDWRCPCEFSFECPEDREKRCAGCIRSRYWRIINDSVGDDFLEEFISQLETIRNNKLFENFKNSMVR